MKKRVLCFLLCAILVAGVLPFGIFADDTITEIAVSGYKAPTIGMTAGEAAADTALPEGAQYYVNSERWWNETDGGSMGPEDVFEIGKIYSYGWTLYAEDGFTFDEDATVTINGGEVAIDWEYTYRSDEDDTVFYVWTLPAEAGLPENAILVDGFTPPITSPGSCLQKVCRTRSKACTGCISMTANTSWAKRRPSRRSTPISSRSLSFGRMKRRSAKNCRRYTSTAARNWSTPRIPRITTTERRSPSSRSA